MKQWQTHAVDTPRQFEYWRELISLSFVSLRPERKNQGAFHCGLDAWESSDLFFGRVYGDGQTVYRDDVAISDQDAPVYFLNVQMKGQAFLEQFGSTARLSAGSYALLDATRPFKMEVSDNFEQLSIKIPCELLNGLLIDPDRAMAVPITDAAASGRFAVKAFTAIADEGDALCDDRLAAVMRDHALSLVAYSLNAHSQSQESTRTKKTLAALRRRATDFLALHVTDPALSVATVARALGVSERYLQLAYSDAGQSLARSLLEMRLQRCRSDLIGDKNVGCAISQTALANGFNDLSYFNRAFKARFGATPSRFKKLYQ